jgi:hypothetical protein
MDQKLDATGVSHCRKERNVSSSHRFLPGGKATAIAEGATAAAVKAKKRVLNIVYVW